MVGVSANQMDCDRPEGIAGDAYDLAMTARVSDRRARSAFQALVLATVKPGGTLYDFGAGTGIDAQFFAESGYRVGAYDIDPLMCRYFAMRCRRHIESGRITLDCGSYAEFLARRTLNGGREADLVTANFAPLNLIENLPELFNRFHFLLAPGGAVLASVLSPYYVGELRYGWWWRNLGRLCRTGHYRVGGAAFVTVRRRLGDYAAQCGPTFVLDRVYRGLPGDGGAPPIGIPLARGARWSWLSLTGCRYMFIRFRKTAGIANPRVLT